MKSVRYEMLGAPTLLYRHNNDQSSSSSHQNQNSHQQQRFHPSTLTPQQIHMREYLEEDPFRKWFLPGGKKTATAKKMKGVQKRTREELHTSTKRTLKRYKSNNNNDGEDSESSNSSAEDENEVTANNNNSSTEKKRTALKYYTFDFDQNDVPSEYMIAMRSNEANNKDNDDDDNDDDDGGNIIIMSTNEVSEQTTRKNEVGGPLGYGNCLVAITCTCRICCASSTPAASASAADVHEGTNDSVRSNNEEDATTSITIPSSFLVHPIGEKLSFVTIDKLILPREETPEDYSSTSSSSSPPSTPNSNTIDVGGTILQIAICGSGISNKIKRMNQEDNCQSECLVVRTSRYCVVILARACSKDSNGSSSTEGEANSNNGYDASSSRCSTTFELMELSRIDLCKPTTTTQPSSSYLPVYVSCDPKVIFSPFANPSFAILSRSNKEQSISGIDCTTIHEIVQCGDKSRVKKHTLSSSLANISLIEYHASEMSVLWAAARAINVPKVDNKRKDKDGNTTTGGGGGGGGTLKGGYGHSLFKINLRNDTALHVWSPSKAEYVLEGVHSINGIMNDLRYKHIVWVSSSSACKVWALDVRQNNAASVVMCFSLAQLSDDFGSELGVAGFYGAGMIMMQPPPSSMMINECAEDYGGDTDEQQHQVRQQDIPPTMFGLKKDPNTYSLHTYQLPTTMTRFQTMPLEGSSFVETPSVKYSTSCIARSNIYPLPICSDKTFRVGLATLRHSSKSALRKVDWKDRLGYDEAPDIIYALTMTSVGDIYCHALLECDSKREVQARSIEGPVGAAAISVPEGMKMDDEVADGCLRIVLRNDFPSPFSDVALCKRM